jgi:3-oxoadipate enol-lactonase
MYDAGSGPPLVLIPGMQGRWEWMRPALDALARHCRTIGYSLLSKCTNAERAFEELVLQLDEVLDRSRIATAAVAGVSFGGLIALHYAALRPARVAKLVMVSTPSPTWSPSPVQERYLARPWLSTPAYLFGSPARMWPEIAAAIESRRGRLRFCAEYALRIAAAPIVPAGMATRIRLREYVDLQADCAHVGAPTLVITGEPGLDRVVPVESTREYTTLIRGAQYVMMDRTGHLGLLTQPERFARIVADFVNARHP